MRTCCERRKDEENYTAVVDFEDILWEFSDMNNSRNVKYGKCEG